MPATLDSLSVVQRLLVPERLPSRLRGCRSRRL